MLFFVIKETLMERSVAEGDFSAIKEITEDPAPFAAVLSTEEWRQAKARFDMGIELDPISNLRMTKAEVNYDSLTGSFHIPDQKDPSASGTSFAFALDEKGVVFIDDHGMAEQIIRNIQRTKRFRIPSLGRFLYDFLDQIVKNDLRLLEKYEDMLEDIEQAIDSGHTENPTSQTNAIRSDLRKLLIHYDQLIDLAQELEENENGFFKEENLRYFHMFTERVVRLRDIVNGQREYVMQLRDLMQSQLDVRQNRIMTVLTVVTSIFLPLTLIAGWYGMNFRYMPELEWRYSYPIVIVISILIVVVCLIWFKRKKWM